jgi:hypothetical protein
VATDPKRLGAEIGFLSILHTWGSNLLPHYHIHCVVPGGGLSADRKRWIHTSHPLFLLPIPVLHTVFRKNFLDGLWQLYRKDLLDCRGAAADFRDPARFEELTAKLAKKSWFVYAKPPLGGPAHVLCYLGRYTHRMAISNHRLVAFDGQRVSFQWRDYAHGNKQRVMTLDAVEFLRRFFLHVLPLRFVRIRRYGLLSNRFRKQLLPLARTLLADQGCEPLPPPASPDCDLWHCPSLRKSHAPRRALYRRTVIPGEVRSLMTAPANPRYGLAPRTSSHQCAPEHQTSLQNRIHRHPRTTRSHTAHATVHHFSSPSATMADPKSIQRSHKSHLHHRDRTACGFLLTLKSKAPRRSIIRTSKLPARGASNVD